MHTNNTASQGQEFPNFVFSRVRWEQLQNQKVTGAIVASLLVVCGLALCVFLRRKPKRTPVRVDSAAYFEEDE